jgi:hypothetical protein
MFVSMPVRLGELSEAYSIFSEIYPPKYVDVVVSVIAPIVYLSNVNAVTFTEFIPGVLFIEFM